MKLGVLRNKRLQNDPLRLAQNYAQRVPEFEQKQEAIPAGLPLPLFPIPESEQGKYQRDIDILPYTWSLDYEKITQSSFKAEF
ncbi:MAG: hypothetical protein F6K14_31410 [Symploca sp. SIO2C1]|nr:hypothetical protein [Symploca sp. SIO2C1]